MPKSKRDKKVSLTKTTKKGLKAKQNLVEEIRKTVGQYNFIFVFSVDNMRNNKLKQLREDWKDSSRFFFGKNKVMTLGLGRKKEDEVEDNLHKLAPLLKGQCGLLFTNKSKEEVIEFFDDFESSEFARTGFIACRSVKVPAGPLPLMAHSIEPHLRSLGMHTSLQKGVVTLLEDYTAARKGKPLSAQQASVLKLIGDEMATFKITLIAVWSKSGEFEVLKAPAVKKQVEEEDEEESVNGDAADVEMTVA